MAYLWSMYGIAFILKMAFILIMGSVHPNHGFHPKHGIAFILSKAFIFIQAWFFSKHAWTFILTRYRCFICVSASTTEEGCESARTLSGSIGAYHARWSDSTVPTIWYPVPSPLRPKSVTATHLITLWSSCSQLCFTAEPSCVKISY
jgi:hypothetical protein